VKNALRELDVRIIPSVESDLALTFHENTKLTSATARRYGEHVKWIASQEYFVTKMAHAYKSYPARPKLALPPVNQATGIDLESVIRGRRTVRNFSGEPITLEKIARILFHAYGITGSIPIPHSPHVEQKLRAVPSAGALYPLEIYPVILKSQEIKPGIYHYNVAEHSLEEIKPGNYGEEIGEMCFAKPFIDIDTSSLVLLLSAVFDRMLFKYQDRGYRFILIEAGHVAQNVSLLCHGMGMGSVLIGGFLDDALGDLVGLDCDYESIIYPIIIGSVKR